MADKRIIALQRQVMIAPSPDIAGLVDKYVHMSAATANERLVYDDGFLSPKMLEPFMEDVRALATALQRVAQERDAAMADRDSHQREAIRTMGELAEARARLFPYADDKEISGMSWGGFYLIGNDKSIKELRRIENAAAQIEVYRAAFDERIAAAEARIASARDEGLEDAALLIDSVQIPSAPLAAARFAAAIRALKGPAEMTLLSRVEALTGRCEVTGNLCGTDTWEASYRCPCVPCQQWLKDQPLAARPAFRFGGAPSFAVLRAKEGT